MLRKLTVFHRGGLVLWSSDDPENNQNEENNNNDNNDNDLSSSPLLLNELIQNVLLLDRNIDNYQHDTYTLKWSYENKFNLIFVAVYFSFQKLLRIDGLLTVIKNEFIKAFGNVLLFLNPSNR